MADDRKLDHIELAFTSRPQEDSRQYGLYYEPMLNGFKKNKDNLEVTFHNWKFHLPIWASSMTGGTEKALKINKNIAKAAGEFGFGMGLGSCRPLLNSEKRFKDFAVKEYMPHMPLFSNYGIAQLEELKNQKQLNKIQEINTKLGCDGIIIHINPLQEWVQPEGDRYFDSPVETIQTLLNETDYPVIVKEVGQGFGPKSLALLLAMPLCAVELAGYGGTNFTMLEHARLMGQNSGIYSAKQYFGQIGHTCEDMIGFIGQIPPENLVCKNVIISGGVSDPITAHALREKCPLNSVTGLASLILKNAMGDYEELRNFLLEFSEALLMAKTFLKA